VSYGSLWQRFIHGVSWTWINEHYRFWLPEDFDVKVMTLESRDRFHAKQGRSTARLILHAGRHTGAPPPDGRNAPAPSLDRTDPNSEAALAVYLKRHFRLPWRARLAALLDPAGGHSPAATEWGHLQRARALGIAVPEVVAAGERIGPLSHFCSFLMVAELTGSEAINELLPRLAGRWDPLAFASLKRRVVAEMARIAANLHRAHVFHRDLYLCHFFLDPVRLDQSGAWPRISLIDWHRLAEHRLFAEWWRWKDLGQLLFSTYGVAGINERDRLRFWARYRRLTGLRHRRWHECVVRFRAARYLAHNRKPR
jgi:heptose I phosphotransferase